ncbi:MAG: hypothetical protein KDK38_14420, partial [Leptospiraceae bacterium]|nr:hypothetical protein [Leptospiraceae bacterium]
MKKTSSQLLYVHHSQQNNPTGLSPAEPVSILSYRSGFQLDQNRNYEFRVKSVKASLSGINTADTQAQALLNAFRTDFITFLSVITDENQLVINNLRPALHTADAGTLVDTNTKQVVRQGKAPLLAHTHLFECKRE